MTRAVDFRHTLCFKKCLYLDTWHLQNCKILIKSCLYCFCLCSMAWYSFLAAIPSTNAMSVYFTLAFGVCTIIFVFRMWLRATCGKFVSSVSSICL